MNTDFDSSLSKSVLSIVEEPMKNSGSWARNIVLLVLVLIFAIPALALTIGRAIGLPFLVLAALAIQAPKKPPMRENNRNESNLAMMSLFTVRWGYSKRIGNNLIGSDNC